MDKLKKFFSNKTIGFYIALASAILAFITDIIFLAADGKDKTFSIITFLLILGGVAAQAVACFIDTKFLPVVMPLCFGTALGMHLLVGLPTLSDVWNGVNFVGGNPKAVVNFGIIFAICTVAAAVSSFMAQRKA